jgi:hypothetical protein
MKTCTKCKVEKGISEYHNRKDTKNGYRNECKLCKRKGEKRKREEHSMQTTRDVKEDVVDVSVKRKEQSFINIDQQKMDLMINVKVVEMVYKRTIQENMRAYEELLKLITGLLIICECEYAARLKAQ